jgi:hypothetical protein
MAAKTTPEYFSLLNQGVSREIQVSIQYMFQHLYFECDNLQAAEN